MPQHIGFKERSTCIYPVGYCTGAPYYYMLCGCLNLHIAEGAICHKHFDEWLNHFINHDVSCTDCGGDIEAYEITETSLLT